LTPRHEIRFARPDEATDFVDLIRATFPASIIQRTTYGCMGARRYVRAAIRAPRFVSPKFLVISSRGVVLAGAEIAVTESDLFLSYISAQAAVRSRGLGTSLMTAIVQHGLAQGLQTMTLDVLEDNTLARNWYTKLGFSSTEERAWWEFETLGTPQAVGSVSGWPQAEVCHQAFGFSEIVIWTDSGPCRVGRLGVDLFRVPDLKALSDDRVLGTLNALDPRRRVLVMGPQKGGAGLGRPVLRLIRLRAALSDLRSLTVGI
jgi:GNAT superfamily N-acetyltransferase